MKAETSCFLSGFDLVDDDLEILLAVTDAFFAVFTSSKMGRIELLTFDDGFFSIGLE